MFSNLSLSSGGYHVFPLFISVSHYTITLSLRLHPLSRLYRTLSKKKSMPTSLTRLSTHDRTWIWKALLRLLGLILCSAGIALTGWAVSTLLNHNTYILSSSYYYYYSDFDYGEVPWNLISFSLSFLWNLTNLSVLLARSRWIHPGANVGCDLFLWLAFIVTALFSTGGAVSELSNSFSSEDASSSSSYYSDGETYYYYPNGTSYAVTPAHPAPPCPGFDSCAQQAHLHSLLHTWGVVVAVASALAWAMVLVHFALFVSACRYTHVRRRERRGGKLLGEKLEGEAQRIEERVIRKLEEEGRLMPVQVQRPQAESSGALQAPGTGPEIRVDGAQEEGAHAR